MKKSLWLGGLVGAVIVFAWGAISHMFGPWHDANLHEFSNEDSVAQMLMQNTTESGIYILPTAGAMEEGISHEEMKRRWEEGMKKGERGPWAFVSIRRGPGDSSMAMPMILEFLVNFIGAVLIAWMLLKTVGLSYMQKVGFITVFAVAAFIVMPEMSNWIWWQFPTQYVMTNFVDDTFGWFLAGLGMGKVVK